jgi:hypothetical protein
MESMMTAPHVEDSKLGQLRSEINKYCRQPKAKRMQLVWVLRSAIVFVLAFDYGLLFAPLERPNYWMWIPVLMAACAVWLMAWAGKFAESDPPAEGRDEVLAEVWNYQPRNQKAYLQLCRKLRDGSWCSGDLVDFLVREQAYIDKEVFAASSARLATPE